MRFQAVASSSCVSLWTTFSQQGSVPGLSRKPLTVLVMLWEQASCSNRQPDTCFQNRQVTYLGGGSHEGLLPEPQLGPASGSRWCRDVPQYMQSTVTHTCVLYYTLVCCATHMC